MLFDFLSFQYFHLIWHQLLHALGLSAGVIVAVTLQQVDCTPDTKTGTERHDERLQYADCTVEKCHR